MSFLTVEDINTVSFSNQEFYWHEIDTANISTISDYTNVKYDFCKVTRETGNYAGFSYRYTIVVNSTNFTNAYIVLDANNNIPSIMYNVSSTDIQFYTNKDSVKIRMYMGNLTAFEKPKHTSYNLRTEKLDLTLKELNETQTIHYKDWDYPTSDLTITISVNKGYNLINLGDIYLVGYLLVNLLKTDFQFQCNEALTIGKVNKVRLGTDSDYKPNGDMIGTYTPTITVVYENQIIPVTFDSTVNDYVFNLDLTSKTDPSAIQFKVIVESNDVLNNSEVDVILHSDYETVNSFNALKSACESTDVIQLGADITFTSSITIIEDVKIIGNAKTFNLNQHNFLLTEGVTFNAENVTFNNGDTTIIQAENTTVELNNCTFRNCTSTEYHDFGSCIFCEIDFDNLEITNDFKTTLNNCLFINNHSCILNGGELTVNKCKLHNTDESYVNHNNVAFLYQVDGNAEITNSIFDIDYDTDSFCENEVNLGFAQAIVMAGETARINNANYTDLQSDNSLPFFNSPINNQAHLFAKYYYPQVSACVYSSPVLSREKQSCCHALSGVDWIFKNNVQVTRVSWDSQNENNPFSWEE